MIKTTIWRAGPFTVITKTGRNGYGVKVMAGKQVVHFSPYSWGPSKCDAIAHAVYSNNPENCQGTMGYLFRRIDYYVDGPNFLDAWVHATIQTN